MDLPRWKDRRVERENTFTLLHNNDGTITLIPVTGNVYEQGTPLNAINLNKLNAFSKYLQENKLDKDGIVTMANMGQDVKEAMTGGSVAVVGENAVDTINLRNKSVSNEKLATRSVNTRNLGYRYLEGILVEGYLNINTENKTLEVSDGTLAVDNLDTQQIAFEAHTQDITLLLNGGYLTRIYFNLNTKRFECYGYNNVLVGNEYIYIATYYYGVFFANQRNDKLKVNNLSMSRDIKEADINTIYLYGSMMNGKIAINTIDKVINITAFNIVIGGKTYYTQSTTIDISHLDMGHSFNIYYDLEDWSVKVYANSEKSQIDKRMAMIGSVFGSKIYNSMSLNFIEVNGISEGGWFKPEENMPTDIIKTRKITLNEVWNHWERGEKFPIAFFGDSTTDGAMTTNGGTNSIGVDYINTYAYPYLLEQLVKKETGSDNVRIYNAGFSGKTSYWGNIEFENVFGSSSPYGDVKMVGISFGINDSANEDIGLLYEQFKGNFEIIIKKCFEKNIQPFICTSQAVIIKRGGTSNTRADIINSLVNKAKMELANKYNLEVIENTKFTEQFLIHSNESIYNVIPDTLHFGDIGHKYEAGLYFSQICPRVIKATEHNVISFLTQNIKTDLLDSQLTRTNEKFKLIVNFNREETTELKVLDIPLFNDTKNQLRLVVHGDVTVRINGERVDIETHLLDLGFHNIEIISNKNIVDFKGIEIIRV